MAQYQTEINFIFSIRVRNRDINPDFAAKRGTPCKSTCELPKESSWHAPERSPEVLRSIKKRNDAD